MCQKIFVTSTAAEMVLTSKFVVRSPTVQSGVSMIGRISAPGPGLRDPVSVMGYTWGHCGAEGS